MDKEYDPSKDISDLGEAHYRLQKAIESGDLVPDEHFEMLVKPYTIRTSENAKYVLAS